MIMDKMAETNSTHEHIEADQTDKTVEGDSDAPTASKTPSISWINELETNKYTQKNNPNNDMNASTKANDNDCDVTEPFPEPVIASELLYEITSIIHKHIVCSTETVNAAALWITMTWVIDAIDVAPLAVITAPEKRCGKSQFLSVIGKMVMNPLATSNITPAALFRTLDAWKPTLLVDECDTFMKENEELRGILNSGHTRNTAYTVRLIGRDLTPKRFDVFGPKALAGIGKLADTLMDRAIKLELRRKLAIEKVERLRHTSDHVFDTIKSKLARFALDYCDQIKNARPTLPDELHDRDQDNWEPLLAIAEIAGEPWIENARRASLRLTKEDAQSASTGIELLQDIRTILTKNGYIKIYTADLIKKLCEDEEKQWNSFNHGKPISAHQIASRLKEFKIKSKTVRGGKKTRKGYETVSFNDAFNRYLRNENET